jgi:phosphatidate cytidylyltransferase
MLVIIVLGMWEFYGLCLKSNIKAQKYFGIFLGISLFTISFFIADKLLDFKYFIYLVPLFLLVFFIELYRKHPQPFSNISYTFLGIIYLALPFSLLNFLVFNSFTGFQFNPKIVLGYIFIIWMNDTGAYLVGVKFGKTRLFERISPKKSWEGSIGGIVFALITGYIISLYFKELALIHWLIIVVLTVISGTLGDLVESMFKRSIEIKDSGSILPGHGGILDRFDSILLSSPIIFFYLQLIA